jgi:hypothetical protein
MSLYSIGIALAPTADKNLWVNSDAHQASSDDVKSKVNSIAAQVAKDETAIQTETSALIAGLIASSIALSLIPFENNYGSELASGLIMKTVDPFVEYAINRPIADKLQGIFRTEHLNPRQYVTAMQYGVLDESTAEMLMKARGLADSDVLVAKALGNLQGYEKAATGDATLIKEYNTKLLDYQVLSKQYDYDDRITDQKAIIKELKSGLPDTQTDYNTARAALTTLKKERAAVASQVYGQAIQTAQTDLETLQAKFNVSAIQRTTVPTPRPGGPVTAPSQNLYVVGQVVLVAMPAYLLAQYQACLNSTTTSQNWPTCKQFDLNNDGKINLPDLSLLGHAGTEGTVKAVILPAQGSTDPVKYVVVYLNGVSETVLESSILKGLSP